MKTMKLSKKLSVNKTTIANLDKLGMSVIQAGKLWETYTERTYNNECGDTTVGGGGGTQSCFTLQDCTH
jgi:hypothetical protein